MGKCMEKYIGRWTGNIYVCELTRPHTIHKGFCGGDDMEWVNTKDYCANSFPHTADVCKRPPGHKGYCRVKIHNQVIKFKPLEIKGIHS